MDKNQCIPLHLIFVEIIGGYFKKFLRDFKTFFFNLVDLCLSNCVYLKKTFKTNNKNLAFQALKPLIKLKKYYNLYVCSPIILAAFTINFRSVLPTSIGRFTIN